MRRPSKLNACLSVLAAALCGGMAGAAAAQTAQATTTVSSSWVILPSEEVVYRYYPKYQQDHGIAGVAEINCRVRNRRDLDQCLIKSETPAGAGFGEAAVRMAEAEFHVLPEATAGSELTATVTLRVAFTPKLAGDSEAAVADAAPATAAIGADDPAAVIAWGRSIQQQDWRYAAPARGQITFWKASARLSPTSVRGTVRYEYFAPAGAPAGAVRSSVVDYEFDCARHAYRPLGVTTYPQPNLGGAPVVLGAPAAGSQPLAAGSVLEDAASRICQFDAAGAAGAAKTAATSASPSRQ